MSTTSAVPEHLISLGSTLRRDAEALLVRAGALADAQDRFDRTCQIPATGLPTRITRADDDVRRVGRRALTLADDTSLVGHAFARADRRRASEHVVVDDRTLDRLVRRGDPVAGLAADLARSSSRRRRAVLSQLDAATTQQLVRRHAGELGNADGVPWRLRVAANHVAIERRRAVAERSHDVATSRFLKRLGTLQVLLFDPVRHRLAVVHGDLDRARNVAVFVPGMGSSFLGFLDGNDGTDNKAAAIADEAGRQRPGDNAVISWLGYPAPPTLARAALSTDGENGAALLTSFVDGLALGRSKRIVLVGHSYGTVVIGEALQRGLVVDDVVVAGSPGMGVDHASSLRGVGRGHVYALAAPGDVVANLGFLGTEPDAPSFGAHRLATNRAGRPRVTAHSKYFTPRSESLRNIAAVVAERPHATQPSSVLDHVEDDLTTAARQTIGRPMAPLHEAAGEYHGAGAPALRALDSLTRVVETMPAHSVELGAAALDTATR